MSEFCPPARRAWFPGGEQRRVEVLREEFVTCSPCLINQGARFRFSPLLMFAAVFTQRALESADLLFLFLFFFPS